MADIFGMGTAAVNGIGGLFGGDPDYQGENSGYPGMPDFMSNLNADGTLKDQYKLNAQPGIDFQSSMGDVNSHLNGLSDLNRNPLNQLEQYSTSGNDNPWVKAQMQALDQNSGQAMGAAKANAAASGAAAADQMAARGGLNSGAMENAMTNNANTQQMAGQGVIGNKLQQQGAIGTQNAQNQLGVLENLPGQEVQALQPGLQKQSLWQQAALQNQQMQQQLAENQQQYKTNVDLTNINNSTGGLNSQNQFNMQNYATKVAQQAGQEQAAAQQKQGKK